MSSPKRSVPLPTPCAVWLKVTFAASVDSAARSRFAARLTSFMTRTGIKSVVSSRLVGLQHPAGLLPFEVSLIAAWVSAQPEVLSHTVVHPLPTLRNLKGRHGQVR